MYAVVDLETTGLRPGWHDRIVEIAVVQLDAAGATQQEWCTLVNPGRDLGPQNIHGITAVEARCAPSFAQVAGQVAAMLRGRVVVAHNLTFDVPFLASEYGRLGVEVPLAPDFGLCTMRLAGQFLPSARRSLANCCRTAGIALTQAHSALHDARAAAQLLVHYLVTVGQPPPWASLLTQVHMLSWPELAVSDTASVARQREGYVPQHFLSRLVDRLPRMNHPMADAYLDILDRALLDRHISATEADALVDVADDLGLCRADLLAFHVQYLQALATLAVMDGVITIEERNDLHTVATLLGLEAGEVNRSLRMAQRVAGNVAGDSHSANGRFQLSPGDVVVFTGQMNEPREVWQARAESAGITVGSSVTKRTTLLVAADPDSMSGKAKQANKYGIPVVHPAAFLRMLQSPPSTGSTLPAVDGA